MTMKARLILVIVLVAVIATGLVVRENALECGEFIEKIVHGRQPATWFLFDDVVCVRWLIGDRRLMHQLNNIKNISADCKDKSDTNSTKATDRSVCFIDLQAKHFNICVALRFFT